MAGDGVGVGAEGGGEGTRRAGSWVWPTIGNESVLWAEPDFLAFGGPPGRGLATREPPGAYTEDLSSVPTPTRWPKPS